VHILLAEGYGGAGIDVRARTSWDHYPTSTQAHLHVHALDPTALPTTAETIEDPFLKPGVFILGNHADELTPWVPILSTICSSSGYLSIPCCAWTFDGRYDRSRDVPYPPPTPNFADSLNLGDEGSNTSSYSMYRIWLASLSSFCGWEVECEVLRIPSTRNWAIIGYMPGLHLM
jgi:tRNASer (uridine44-2'-O)-methyltransferase